MSYTSKQLSGEINCTNCHQRITVSEKTLLVCPECGAYNGLIEFKTARAAMADVAVALGRLLAEKQWAIRQMETLAADAQCQADLKDDTTWSRIAYACHHEVMALRWHIRALQERLDGGPAVAHDTKVLWNIADMLVTLAQCWRGP
jgi:predicted RNA-binding Zn-ribbon protein involved in translation (DUF1610 family)